MDHEEVYNEEGEAEYWDDHDGEIEWDEETDEDMEEALLHQIGAELELADEEDWSDEEDVEEEDEWSDETEEDNGIEGTGGEAVPNESHWGPGVEDIRGRARHWRRRWGREGDWGEGALKCLCVGSPHQLCSWQWSSVCQGGR